MSEQPHAANNSITKPATPQDQARTHPELAELDARLKRIKDNHLLENPYILTVPTNFPFRLDPNRFHDWQRDTPFQHYEEQLQYLSFLGDWDDGVIKAIDGWMPYQLIRDRQEAEETAFMERTLSQQSVKSGASGSGGFAKKVKYSLSDYKKKAAGPPAAGGAREDRPSSKTNGVTAPRRGSSSSRSSDRGLKRAREDGEISEASEDIPLKRRRSSGSRSVTPPIRSLELPPEISPTLPPVIERELARLGKVDRLDSTSKHSDQTQSKHKASERDTKLLKAESAERRDDGKPRPKVTDRSSPGVPNGTSTKVSKSQRDEDTRNTSKPRKIIKLKIGKAIRKSVERLLKLPPRPQKKSEGAGKGVARKVERISPRPDQSGDREKRRREDHSDGDDDRRSGTVKRSRHPNNLDVSKPTTPLPSAFRSPALSAQPTNPKTSVTSDPSGKTLAVPRDDGGGASTPSGGVRNGTPTAPDSVERPHRDGKASSRQQRSAAYNELRRVEKDMFTLGRDSKHSSDRELNAENSPSPRRIKRGLAFGLECILSFMLSYTVRDEMNRLMPPTGENAATETWTTIFPYIQRIKKTALSNEHKHIQGLCLQLEAVCHLAAWTNNVGRAVASDQPSSSTSTAALMKHYHSAAKLFADGTAALPVDALQHSFPHTWTHKNAAPLASLRASSSAAGSNGAASGSAAAKFDPHPIGDFALPITNITTGVEAVRAGRALLVEWCDRQKLDWTPSLGRKRKDDRERDRERDRDRGREKGKDK